MKNKYALVTTCLNEISNVDLWVGDVCAQSAQVDQIVIVDAGSTDGTHEVLTRWAERDNRVVVMQVAGASVACGRNLAIGAAACDVIISTDMGCRVDVDWIRYMVEPFERDETCLFVAGNFCGMPPSPVTVWSLIADCLSEGNRPRMDTAMLPSSRSVAYNKIIWSSLNGYAEDLTYAADDTVFALEVKGAGYRMDLAPRAMVGWLRPATLLRYIKERRGYGFGEGEAGVNCPTVLRMWRTAPDIILFIIAIVQGIRGLGWIIQHLHRSAMTKLVGHAFVYMVRCRFGFLVGYKRGLKNGDMKCFECRKRVHKARLGGVNA